MVTSWILTYACISNSYMIDWMNNIQDQKILFYIYFTFQLFWGILHLEPQLNSKDKEDAAMQVVKDLACEILTRLPPQFDLNQAEKRYPVTYSQSLNIVLRQVSTSLSKAFNLNNRYHPPKPRHPHHHPPKPRHPYHHPLKPWHPHHHPLKPQHPSITHPSLGTPPSPTQAFVTPYNSKFDSLLCCAFIVYNVLVDISLLYFMS